MKTLKTTLALFVAALLPLALLATPSSAATGVPDSADVGNLYQEASATDHTRLSPPFTEGQRMTLVANFADGVKTITFYRNTGSGWQSLGSKTSTSSGNAKLDYTVLGGEQELFAEVASGNLETEVDSITGTVPPPPEPQTGVLNAPTNNGKNWTADFNPGIAGTATKLQMQRIYTKETDEVNDEPVGSKEGPWITVATANQDAAGHVVFPTLSSPYPYRVAHKFRATSGGTNISNTQVFGLTQTTPKSTGLSAVYFNTNEGHDVDTRTRYFEGEFEMTADNKPGVECPAVPIVKNSVMKGRGNYSWSFRRKSFTLKLGSKKNLCGMGESTKYALVSQDYDKSFLRNSLAGYIGKKFTNMAWTPDSQHVDFYLNGKYLGNYLLIERIAIDPARVNIPELKAGDGKKDCNGVVQAEGQRTNENHPNNLDPCVTGGYILEWDFRKGADENVTAGSSGWVGIKDPENDLDREGNITNAGISPQQKAYIDDYLGDTDNALKNAATSNSWKNYIDEASAVDYFLAMEYMKPVDGNMWASVYMYKQRNGKLFFGPMWDFDLAAGSATRAGNVASPSGWYLKNNINISAKQISPTYPTWFNRLNQNQDFRDAAKARWNAIKGSIDTDTFLEQQKAAMSTSANTSFASAPNGASHSYRISSYQVIKGSSWSSDFSYLKSWANSRKSWLNGSSGFN